ncbi:MAG: extradiol dioxygenase [Burkholderiales bacterium]|nr:extradiol dioxygenase [Burkholderiales bacterium]
MSHPNFVILYVANPLASAAFYQNLLAKAPLEASPGFALFALDSGLMLGLWLRQEVLPQAGPVAASNGELVFALDDQQQVQTRHVDWQQRGLPILQAPQQMDFGYTFVAADPDGHRLRVYAAGAA